MRPFIIRNDDVAFDTDLGHLERFCNICDKHGFQIIQAVIPAGEHRKANAKMTNQEIVSSSQRMFVENEELVKYLKARNDLIGVHGLWHTHAPSHAEIRIAKQHLQWAGFKPEYFVPPFNEGDYPEEVEGLKTCKLDLKKGQRLEDFLKRGTPTEPIMYLHSWRFGEWYPYRRLDKCLERLSK